MANLNWNHTVVLVLMIISAVKACQLPLNLSSLWMITHWAEQTVNTHRISCTWFTGMVSDIVERGRYSS